jgi:hypothetical protein
MPKNAENVLRLNKGVIKLFVCKNKASVLNSYNSNIFLNSPEKYTLLLISFQTLSANLTSPYLN